MKSVLFDLDGTLADTLNDLTEAFNTVLTEYKQPLLTAEALKPLVSEGSRYMIPMAFHISPEDSEYALIRQKIFAHFQQQQCRQTKLYPHVMSLLDTLDQWQVIWGIVTNKPEQLARQFLDFFALNRRCHVLVGGDTTPYSKPHPAPILHACNLLQIAPATCLFVGDSLRDMQAAHSAGAESITVSYGYGSQLINPPFHNTLLINDVLEILTLLKSS